METTTSIFLIWIHVTTMFGNEYFVQPNGKENQRAFVSKDACEIIARTVASTMKSATIPPGITFKGAKCRAVEIKR